jgi:hypothetical protein
MNPKPNPKASHARSSRPQRNSLETQRTQLSFNLD